MQEGLKAECMKYIFIIRRGGDASGGTVLLVLLCFSADVVFWVSGSISVSLGELQSRGH